MVRCQQATFQQSSPIILGSDFTGRPSAPSAQKTDSTPGPSTEVTTETPHSGHSKSAQKILKQQKQPPAPTLFMGNLPFEIESDDIRTMLEAHRKAKEKRDDEENDEEAPAKPNEPKQKWLKKIRLGTFEDSGKCKGCVS